MKGLISIRPQEPLPLTLPRSTTRRSQRHNPSARAKMPALGILLGGTDVDGDNLTFNAPSSTTHGTLSGTAPDLNYQPAPNYTGPDSFTFTAFDGFATSAPATISITVNPLNDPPVLNSIGNKNIAELANLTFSATGSDPEAPPQTLTFSLTSAPGGASIGSSSGIFNWTPTETQVPGAYPFFGLYFGWHCTTCEAHYGDGI